MSKVTYKVGNKEFLFETNLQIVNLLAVETCLIEEIKKHKLKNNIAGKIKDIVFQDDNGLVAVANDFEKIDTLTIVNIPKNKVTK